MLNIAGFNLHDEGFWDDLRSPLVGKNVDVTSGRIDYNYDENVIEFATNARYTEEVICLVQQLPHAWREGSAVRPHLHWVQEEDADPNWLLGYRTYNNGAAADGAFTLAAPLTQRVFPYSSGAMMQITKFPEISMAGINVSGMLDIHLYRDTANASTLFSGADAYSVAAQAKEYDTHFQLDSFGSIEEFTKQT